MVGKKIKNVKVRAYARSIYAAASGKLKHRLTPFQLMKDDYTLTDVSAVIDASRTAYAVYKMRSGREVQIMIRNKSDMINDIVEGVLDCNSSMQ